MENSEVYFGSDKWAMLITQWSEATEQIDIKPGFKGGVQANDINAGVTTKGNLSLTENIM